MLTRADDFPIHQTPEPVAYVTADRNFYDRYFFNGYDVFDLESGVFFAVALGVYPNFDVMDSSFSVIIDGVQHNLRASKEMGMERTDMKVGPIEVTILEPLQKLNIKVDAPEHGIKADLTCTGRHFPIEEPRFTRRNGPRIMMDVTRLTQNVSWEGFIEIAGKRHEITPSKFFGTRDRSWGIRPTGAGDPQPNVPAVEPQFYWLWTPSNLTDACFYFHSNDDGEGLHWNRRAVYVPGNNMDKAVEAMCHFDVSYRSGSRRVDELSVTFSEGPAKGLKASIKTGRHFYMSGIGYMHPEWGHGHHKGALATHYDTYQADTDDNDFGLIHIQALSEITIIAPDGKAETGHNVVEQLLLGPHAPSGFSDLFDLAP